MSERLAVGGERLDIAQHDDVLPGLGDSTPVVNAQTPTSSVERKWPRVACAPSIAPSSFERPSPIGSSIEPEMSITSSTDDGLRIWVHWSIAAETTSTSGLAAA